MTITQTEVTVTITETESNPEPEINNILGETDSLSEIINTLINDDSVKRETEAAPIIEISTEGNYLGDILSSFLDCSMPQPPKSTDGLTEIIESIIISDIEEEKPAANVVSSGNDLSDIFNELSHGTIEPKKSSNVLNGADDINEIFNLLSHSKKEQEKPTAVAQTDDISDILNSLSNFEVKKEPKYKQPKTLSNFGLAEILNLMKSKNVEQESPIVQVFGNNDDSLSHLTRKRTPALYNDSDGISNIINSLINSENEKVEIVPSNDLTEVLNALSHEKNPSNFLQEQPSTNVLNGNDGFSEIINSLIDSNNRQEKPRAITKADDISDILNSLTNSKVENEPKTSSGSLEEFMKMLDPRKVKRTTPIVNVFSKTDDSSRYAKNKRTPNAGSVNEIINSLFNSKNEKEESVEIVPSNDLSKTLKQLSQEKNEQETPIVVKNTGDLSEIINSMINSKDEQKTKNVESNIVDVSDILKPFSNEKVENTPESEHQPTTLVLDENDINEIVNSMIDLKNVAIEAEKQPKKPVVQNDSEGDVVNDLIKSLTGSSAPQSKHAPPKEILGDGGLSDIISALTGSKKDATFEKKDQPTVSVTNADDVSDLINSLSNVKGKDPVIKIIKNPSEKSQQIHKEADQLSEIIQSLIVFRNNTAFDKAIDCYKEQLSAAKTLLFKEPLEKLSGCKNNTCRKDIKCDIETIVDDITDQTEKCLVAAETKGPLHTQIRELIDRSGKLMIASLETLIDSLTLEDNEKISRILGKLDTMSAYKGDYYTPVPTDAAPVETDQAEKDATDLVEAIFGNQSDSTKSAEVKVKNSESKQRGHPLSGLTEFISDLHTLN